MRIIIVLLAAALRLTAAVTIHADFEGGSIGRVEQVSPYHFICAVKGEVDQDKRNRQASWYYFRVDGAAGHELTLEFTDLLGEYDYKPNILPITSATRPFVSTDRRTWTPLPDSAVEWDEANTRLRIRFTPSASPVWVAHVPPYTTADLAKLTADLKGWPYVTSGGVGKSAGGRELLLLTVTNPAIPAAKKKVLWIMARQHAWESGTSWVMEGIVRHITSAGQAKLRDAFIFKFFPMADPDGVVRGGVRFNVNGYDVNRNWDVHSKLMPEISAMRNAVLAWVDGGGRIDLFLSLHNTNNDYLQGPLTAAGPEYRRMIEQLADRLRSETVFEPKAPRDWPPGEVARGRAEAPRGLFDDRRICTLLLEQNTRTNSKLGRPLSAEDYRKFGVQLAGILVDVVTAAEPTAAVP